MNFTLQKIRLASQLGKGAIQFLAWEKRKKRLGTILKSLLTNTAADSSWAMLLEECAQDAPEKTFLKYRNERFTYREMNANAARCANYLSSLGGGPGKGLGIFMRNSPRFMDMFFGYQKAGMYGVTINPELRGEGLAYVINHSDIDYLVADAELLEAIEAIIDRLEKITPDRIIVDDLEEEAQGIAVPEEMRILRAAYSLPALSPDVTIRPDDICLIIYTSGTTGPPKGVVYRYNATGVNRLRIVGHALMENGDIYYTYLSLCHGNALFVSTTTAMAGKGTIALSRKFSASRFWDEIRDHECTVVNTIGSIIPILMKQPEKPNDRDNNIRLVFSAACPADMWEAFENRFDVTIYEAYGAIDGGGKGIMNLGTAPKGSLGRPVGGGKVKLVDDSGNTVSPGEAGELLFKVGNRKSSRVEYYKNEAASEKKVKDGWLYTGDILKMDANGFFYFVGRNTESMRKGGENVSAYEVEHVVMQHPAVEDVAVYAVPSEMSEDEIMAAVKCVSGYSTDAEELRDFLKDKLAKYALPRYIRFVDEFPKTNTHRIIKRILEDEGVTNDTYDALEAVN